MPIQSCLKDSRLPGSRRPQSPAHPLRVGGEGPSGTWPQLLPFFWLLRKPRGCRDFSEDTQPPNPVEPGAVAPWEELCPHRDFPELHTQQLPEASPLRWEAVGSQTPRGLPASQNWGGSDPGCPLSVPHICLPGTQTKFTAMVCEGVLPRDCVLCWAFLFSEGVWVIFLHLSVRRQWFCGSELRLWS